MAPASKETANSPDGEIGRRSGLKIRRPQGHGGSSPPPGTNTYMSYNIDYKCVERHLMSYLLPNPESFWAFRVEIQVQCASSLLSASCKFVIFALSWLMCFVSYSRLTNIRRSAQATQSELQGFSDRTGLIGASCCHFRPNP